MKAIAVTFIITLLGLHSAIAQTLWPDDLQWQALKKAQATDADVKRVLTAQIHIADTALATPPQAIATISTAGRLQGDTVKMQTEASLKDMDKIQALAIAYKISGDPRYLQRTGEFLNAWASTNQPTGQPIDETNVEPAIFAYRIVRAEIDPARRQQIDSWLQNMAHAEIASRDMSKGTATNNWHSHRLKVVGMIGYALGEKKLIAYARDGFKAQINDNLRPDGQSIDFIERDALSYHVYDIRPLVTLARAFAEDGDDYYHWQAPNGASLAKSMAWLVPYINGEKTHAEFVGSRVRFDIARSKNHEQGHEVGSLYEPRSALPLFDSAAAFDPSYVEFVRGFGQNSVNLLLVLATIKNN